MKMVQRFLILTFCMALHFPGVAQKVEAVKVTNLTSVDNVGMYYALPKTILVLNVDVTKVTTKAPADPKLVERLFGANYESLFGKGVKPNVTGETYKLGDFTLSNRAAPDLNEVYQLEFKRSWRKNKSLALTLSPAGLIQGADYSVEDKTFDIVTKGLSSIISIAAIPLGLLNKDDFDAMKTSIKLKDGPEKQLRERILGLLQSRHHLMTSSRGYPGDGEALKLQLEKIEELLNKELEKLFGTTKKETKTLTFEVDFADEKKLAIEVFKFDPKKGVQTLVDNPRFINPFPTKDIDQQTISIKLKELSGSLGDQLKDMANADQGDKGLPYRIPIDFTADVVITDNGDAEGTIKLRTVMPMAQFSTVAYLPKKLDKVNVQYYEQLGSIKSVTATTNSISPEAATAAAGVITSAKDLADGKSELERLTEENALLEARKKNEELEQYKDPSK